jgi:ribonucleoside-diphosphate reductase alpha chain
MFEEKRKISGVAINILKKRYFRNGETTWEELVDRVINYVLPTVDEEQKQLTRDMIKNRYFIPNSPCLVNSGKNGTGLLACFVVDFPDNIEGIYQTKLNFAKIARKGGGCGTYLGKIRPEGSSVAGSTHGYAGGPLKFADTISHDMDALTQSGFRAMAIMLVQDIYHPDIVKFINAKADEGKIANANISVLVDDAFMELVEKDEEYKTWFDYSPENFREIKNVAYGSTYKARDIFNLIIEGMWRNGEPGILFKDRINDSPYKYSKQEILCTNPCLSKDTILPISKRLIRISNAGCELKTWKTGTKSCIKLATNAGHELILTPDHKIMLENGEFIEAKDSLNKNIRWALGDLRGNDFQRAKIVGFLFGDGFICGKGNGISVKLNKNIEIEMYNLLVNWGFKEENCGTLYANKARLESMTGSLNFLENRVFNRDIPDFILLSDSSYLRSFVSGLFEANGSVTKLNQISFKSTNKEQAKKLQIILSAFGIESWIVENKPVLIRWKNGDYASKESYNLQIAPRNAFKFKERIGFISNRKNNKIRALSGKYRSKLKVISIEQVGEREVWDFSNESHYSIANGIYVHNCSEQPLPFGGSCNLGSIDISKYLLDDLTIDLEMLETSVRLAVRFLNTVIDRTSYPTEEIENWSMENRPVGLGKF